MGVTRLAPSPTGALHLGNARTFLANWLMARQMGWKIILRIEDLDGPRIKADADREAVEDLRWLGMDWDEGPVYQSTRLEVYRAAIDRLLESGVVYPCVCTRKDVERAASAPHAEDGATIYPGTCRGKYKTIEEAREASGREPTLRFAVPNRVVVFEDGIRGLVSVDVGKLGDFVVAKADGTPAYQLAVVVDDAEMGVSEVVRGDDLLESTPRQILIYEALGMEAKVPAYWHLPLVVGEDGKRLAKRHGDTRVSSYRELGVSAGRVLELLARWMGIEGTEAKVKSAGDLVGKVDVAKMARGPIIFTAADDRWLKAAGV